MCEADSRLKVESSDTANFIKRIGPQILLNAEVEILKEFAVAIQQFYTVSPLRLLMFLG